ncbi:MAG TPA: DegT/DnrJ/EryC1/StrS family aminotransferase [Solirubrobacteraceae bacterium]
MLDPRHLPAASSALDPAEPTLLFGAPCIGEDEIAELVRTLRSGWIGTGPKTQLFERRFAEYVGTRFAFATNSGTAALHLSLLGLGVGPGDEVITTPLTFVATANVIEHCGARPVFVDVDRKSGNIDPDAVAAAITPKTKAIMPIHYLGALADIAAIRAAAGATPVVVDAAHAVEGRHAAGGSSAWGSDSACYSFYVTKNLVTGEGGMLATDDEQLAQFARVAGLHGLDNDAYSRYSSGSYRSYDLLLPGFKYNMTDMQASLGLHQLKRIDESALIRSQLWGMYNERLAGIDGVTVPPVARDHVRGDHARHLFTLWCDWERLGVTREQLVHGLREHGIGTGWHFRPVHLHRFYRERYGYAGGECPNAERIAHATISIPLSASLTSASIDRVSTALREVLRDPPVARAAG